MPHAEPYVVNSAERALDVIPLSLHTDTRAYIRQERQHHVQHRRSIKLCLPSTPGFGGWTPPWQVLRFLGRRSLKFGIAFAAGFETIAYAGARWTEPRISTLFDGADEEVSRLFLWHLAEEVEHKGVAHDAWEAARRQPTSVCVGHDGGRGDVGRLQLRRGPWLCFGPSASCSPPLPTGVYWSGR